MSPVGDYSHVLLLFAFSGNPERAMKVQLRQVETHQLAEIEHLAAALEINALYLEGRTRQPAGAKFYLSAGFQAPDKYLLMSLAVDKQTTPKSTEDNNQ
jgi:hypothetical protein